MKNLFISLFISILSVANVCAQEWKDAWTDQQWTNGWQMMSSLRINKSQVMHTSKVASGTSQQRTTRLSSSMT